MQRLEEEGFTHIAVQSTHVMHGEEYEKMLSQLEPYRLRMKVSVGMPLLHGEEDYAAVAQALLNWLPPLAEDEALVLMGHGTTHFANSAYAQMEHMLKARCILPRWRAIPRWKVWNGSLPNVRRSAA